MPRFDVLSAVLLLTAPLAAETLRVRTADEFQRAVSAAKPGDTVLVAGGEYARNFHFRGIHGAAERRIVIAAEDATRPPQFIGGITPLHFSGASYLELKDLVIANASGNGLNIDDGGDPDKPARHITLRNLRVRDVGPKGNRDGIKFSGVDDFLVEGCTVERWGSSGSGIDLVGCHRGVVVDCTFREGGANGVQAKGGSAEITLRKCRFENAGQRGVNLGGSTGGDSFRPRLTDFPQNGKYEAKNLTVEGCTFVGGTPIVFVGVDGATVRYNTIYLPERYAIRILQEQTEAGFVPCRGGVFERNVVVFRSDAWVTGGVNLGGGTAPQTFTFADNLWYCEDRPSRSRPTLPVAEKDGLIGQDPRLVGPAKGDFGVDANSPAHDRGAHGLPASGG